VCRLDDQTRAQRQSSACDVAMYSETQEISQQALKPDDGPSVIEPDERRYAGRACDDPRDCLSTGSHKTACVPLSPGSTRAFKGAFHANSGSNLRRACEGMLPLCCKRGRSQAAQSTAQACNCVARGCGSIETREEMLKLASAWRKAKASRRVAESAPSDAAPAPAPWRRNKR
jgi:hypothetical protein